MGNIDHDPFVAQTKGDYDKLQEEAALMQFLIDSSEQPPPEVVMKPKTIKQAQNSELTSVGEEWKKRAACNGGRPAELVELFFSNDDKDKAMAARVCGSCAVKQECVVYAVQHGENFGIWGGYDFNVSKERHAAKLLTGAIKLRKPRRRSA